MTNQADLLKEINSKVKPGIKPSQLKKSHSADDLGTVKDKQDKAQLFTQINSLQTQLTSLQAQLTAKDQEITNTQATIAELNTQIDKHLEKRLAALKKDDQHQAQIKQLQQQIVRLRQLNNNPRFGTAAWANQLVNRVIWASVLLTLLTLVGQWLISND